MRVIPIENGLSGDMRGSVAALGNFDGVHRGHQALLAAARSFAGKLGAPFAVAVFEPHPREFFRPDDPPFRLTDLACKARQLERCGAEKVFVIQFDAEMAARAPEAFVADVLDAQMGLKGVAVGSDFRFGKGRAGDAQSLKTHGAPRGIQICVIEPVGETAEKFSSTQARAALRAGDPRRAAHILGHFWSIESDVAHGAQRGRSIGFPTANLSLGAVLAPKFGVYAVRAEIVDSGRSYDGVANFGRRPTVGSASEPLLEAHLFDFDGDLYGRRLCVSLVDFIREERKFSGLEELQAQIARDCEAARAALSQDGR